MKISKDPIRNTAALRERFHNSFDLQIRTLTVNGRAAAAVYLNGMCDEARMAETVINPLTDRSSFPLLCDTARVIRTRVYKGMGLRETDDLTAAAQAVTEGELILFIEKEDTAFLFGMQGFPKKGIEKPEAEQNELGGGERFADGFLDSAALLRKRLKTPELTMERILIGRTSRTTVLICYLADRADGEIVKKIRRQLADTKLDTLPGSGCLKPFLDKKGPAAFSAVGHTERPDMLAAKLAEGRVGILADGSPYALIVPYLFIDHFHSMDDYMGSAAAALFLRILRLTCFITGAVLPGLFVAACGFHPEVLPPNVMLDIAAAEAKTPFSLMAEAAAIHLIYEVVREAGLRMPVAVGHAVSIVGALVVGDAAVTAGLIAAPMLMVVAVTAICSAVVPKLHAQLALIRLGLILLGGLTGFFGVFAALGLLLADACASGPYGVPFSAPFSPFVRSAQKDALWRAGWRRLAAFRPGVRELEKG